jgi:hypothetical protein
MAGGYGGEGVRGCFVYGRQEYKGRVLFQAQKAKVFEQLGFVAAVA